MKKTFLLIVCAIVLSLFTAVDICAEDGRLEDLSRVQNVYVYNIENDTVLYSKNENDKIYPASTVKMMTGIIALEHYNDGYGKLVTVSKESLGSFSGKNIGLSVGEQLTVEHLLYAVICGGANDAANVLAYEIAGSHSAFLNMMNKKADELGMKNTHYTNAYGYSDPGMYTTAQDTAILARYAYYIRDYMEMCNTARYVIPENNLSKKRYVYNSNYLIATNVEIKYKNPEVKGMNAGSTAEGGHVVVTSVSREGTTNIYVLMGGQIDEDKIYTYSAIKGLIDWSYDSYAYVKILDANEIICEMDVSLSSQVDYVVLSPEKTVECYLPSDLDVSKDIKREIKLDQEKLTAPVEAGFVAGKIKLTYKGEVIAEVNLVAKNNVNRNGFLYILARIKSFTQSSKFKIILVVAAVVLVLYFILALRRKRLGNRYKYKYNKYGKK